MHERRRGVVGGLILIVLGIVFLVAQRYPEAFGAWMIVVGLAVIFLAAYLATREYGFLIPGSILMGIGVPLAIVQYQTSQTGMVIEGMSLDQGGLVVLGLGLGFVCIWLIDLLVSRGRPGGWWPLIPGGLLLAAGLAIASNNEQWLETIGQWWPLIFIVIGCGIVLQVIRRN
jgi:hypothetical protein